MATQLRVIGAGLPRTGTTSLRAALTMLLGGPCHHMHAIFERPETAPVWQRVVEDDDLALADELLDGFVAAIDWPASVIWRGLVRRHPNALVVLSSRDDADVWFESFSATVHRALLGQVDTVTSGWPEMARAMALRVFGPAWRDPDVVRASYDRIVDEVRAEVPTGRLLEWRAEDGWAPIADALGVVAPDEPFPHLNARTGWA